MRLKSGFIISVSGLDGVGKSTLINQLAEKMETLSIPATTFQLHLGFTPRMKRLRSKFFRERKSNSSHDAQTPVRKPIKSILSSEIYKYLSILDQILTFIQIQYLKKRGERLIVDRYYWDNWIIYIDKFGKPNFFMDPLWKIIKFVAGDPTLAFMLTLPPEETYQRIYARKPGKQEQTLETLRHREKLYRALNIKNIIHIDAAKTREEILSEVWSYIEKI